jgi:hypothetical protein
MIRIKVDPKDVSEIPDGILAANGYEIDRESEDFDWLYLENENCNPSNEKEAYDFIGQTFRFAPEAIWINGKKAESSPYRQTL